MTAWTDAARLTVWAWLASMAACVSLAPLVQDKAFLLVGAGAGAMVALVGGVGRALRVPVVLVLVLQLFVLLEWLTFAYAFEPAWGGLVPTRDSMAALVDVVRGAVAVSEEYAPPAPEDPDLAACMAAAVAGVALVIDLVAVSWRRPALVGLVFLAVYMAPVSLLAGNVPVLAFVPGALAFVFLLGAEQRDRVGHWGRQLDSTGSLLSVRDRGDVRVSPLIRSGRRVGLGAVALAVVVPAIVPTLPRTFLAEGPLTADQTNGEGDGVVAVDNPMLDLRRNLGDRSTEVLATVQTDGAAPSYLRIAALDEFTGSSWVPGPRDADDQTSLDRVAVPPGLTTSVRRETSTYEVSLSESFATSWLPTLYPLAGARAEGPWGVDPDELDVSSLDEEVDGAGLSYTAQSNLVIPTADELQDTGPPSQNLSRYVDLPAEMPSIVEEQARLVTADTDTRFDAALALQDWFRSDGGFRYSLEAGTGDGMDTIEAFLGEDRVGYCEQFAAAMALMARELGIPARVAVGFLRPEALGSDRYAFRGVDMHAWPELYFDGVGWVRFEPTPPARTGAAPDFGNTDDDPATATTGTESTRPLPTEAPTTRDDVPASGSGGNDTGGVGGGLLVTLGAVLLVGLLAAAPRVARTAVRGRRWRRAGTPGGPPVAEAAWRELGDLVVDLGVRIDQSSTLRTAGRGLRSLVDDEPGAVTALNRLVVDAERSRFARGGSRGARPRDEAVRDVEAVRARIAATRTGSQRWRARWLPASLLPRGRDRRTGGARRTTSRPGLLLRADDQPGD